MKTITIGFDNSDIDQYTLTAAKTLNDALPVKKLICAHVEPKFDIWDALYHKEVTKLASEEKELNTIKKELEKSQIFYLNGKSKDHTNVVVKHGKVVPELIGILEKNESDLLILGQQDNDTGHGTLIRNLIRRSMVNILVVPKISLKKIKTIVVAVDFSKCSEKVVQTVHEMAIALGGNVTIKLMHVYSVPFFIEERDPIEQNDYIRGTANAVCRAFSKLTEKYEFPGTSKLEYIELTSEPDKFHEAIAQTAKSEHADLLIVGNVGHSPYKQFYLGSVAEKLTFSKLPCATLFVSCNQ